MSTPTPTPKQRAAALARRAAHSRPGQKLIEAIREGDSTAPAPAVDAAGEPDLDGWLTSMAGDRLAAIDAACAEKGPDDLSAYELFRDLDDDLWSILLSRQYTSYPNILALLPEVPDPQLQVSWNGASGLALLSQTKAFYRHSKAMFAEHGTKPLDESRVLDFGFGWGRILRFFARDIAPGSLLGVDPTEDIIEVSRKSRIPAEMARSEFLPESLPYGDIDLAYSFSVFTHISEGAADTCLNALHKSLAPGGLLIVTIRPPAYLELDPKMHGALAELGDPVEALKEPRYVFVPHEAEGHPQEGSVDAGEMTYGDCVISLPFVKERWGDRFELLDVHVTPEDMYQVAVTLRRR
ncbi:MAG: class I SAM-dependent methyltransferase [Solirubrobacterales bacterium]